MRKQDKGDSPVIAVVLMVALIVIIALIIMLYCLGMLNGFLNVGILAPPLIKISSVLHTNPLGTMNYASRVFIENTNTEEYKNRELMAVFFRNGKEVYAKINTLHGEGFIPTQHFGVATMGGSGCRGEYFSPGEKIEINLKDRKYIPGDLVELRIFQKSGDTSMTPFIGSVADYEYMKEWTNENFYSNHPGFRIISQHTFNA